MKVHILFVIVQKWRIHFPNHLLLKPRALFTKGISGAGRWGVRYSVFGHPSFCTVVEGRCRLAVDGQDALVLEAGDFVLLPTTPVSHCQGSSR